MFPIKLKEKKMEIYDHPRFVQMSLYRYYLLFIIAAASSVAVIVTYRNITFFVLGFVISLTLLGIILHIRYILTRDEALVLDGKCIDIIDGSIPIFGNLERRSFSGSIVIRPKDAENNYIYRLPYKRSYHCNVGDGVYLYVMQSAMYMDINENIVINSPLFIKITKS